jgi:SAM-dependent MidA family methyltransferase
VHEWHRLVPFDKKIWHPGVPNIDPRRKGKRQGRSIQQSKLFVTLVMHRRATFNDKHNQHVLIQMSRSIERLFKSPEHMGSLFKFGLLWTKDHWATWAP